MSSFLIAIVSVIVVAIVVSTMMLLGISSGTIVNILIVLLGLIIGTLF